jgi:transcriptional regulator with GAF, ATPase, and Fis domain
MKTAATSPKLSTALAKDQERYEALRTESDELAAAKAELEQVRAQLYGVLEGARAAFSAEDGIVRVLAEAEQIDEVADAVLEILCESFEYDTATFWLLDPEDGKLCAIAHHSAPTSRARFLEARIRSAQLALNEGIAGRVFVERKAFLSDDAPPSSDKEIGMLLADDNLRTVCAFPILATHAPLGVIEMERRAPLSPDQAIESAARIIGDRIGAFMEFSQLHWRYFGLVSGINRTARKASEPVTEPATNVVPLRHVA